MADCNVKALPGAAPKRVRQTAAALRASEVPLLMSPKDRERAEFNALVSIGFECHQRLTAAKDRVLKAAAELAIAHAGLVAEEAEFKRLMSRPRD